MTTMAETARTLAATMTCSRCRSENLGDLKFCRFCGCRLRLPPPVESFVRPGEAARPTPSPFIPVDVELAKRYVAEGKHHFATGNLDRAGECFRRALDAAPGHPQLVGFLRRVGELKARLVQSGAPVQAGGQVGPGAPVQAGGQVGSGAPVRTGSPSSLGAPSSPGSPSSVRATSAPPTLRVLPSMDPGRRRPASDVAVAGPGTHVISLRRPPALSVIPGAATVEPGPSSGSVRSEPASDPRPRVVAAAGSLRADPAAELPTAVPGRTASALAERRTGARVLQSDRPLSPALLMDRASGLEAWNETVAGVMVMAGLLTFGWILMFW